MAINRGFSLSAKVIEIEADTVNNESISWTDSYDISASVSTGTANEGIDSMGLVLNADILALGEDSYALLSAEGGVIDGAVASSAKVSLTGVAVASSPEQAYAYSTTSIGLIGGADRLLTLNYSAAIVDQSENGMDASAASLVYLYALTVDSSAVGASATILDSEESENLAAVDAPSLEEPCGCIGGGGFSIDGNLALFDINLDVVAEDSYLEYNLNAFAIEDQLANVTMSSILIAG